MRARWALALILASSTADAQAPPLPATATSAAADFEEAPAERFPGEAEEIRRLAEQTTPSGAEPIGRSLGGQLIQTVFMLGAICALAYLILGKLLPRVMGMSAAGRRALVGSAPTGLLQVVDRLALDPRRALLVVKVGEEHFLIGMTDQSMTHLARLDDSTLPSAPENKPLLGAFGRLLERRLDKEGS